MPTPVRLTMPGLPGTGTGTVGPQVLNIRLLPRSAASRTVAGEVLLNTKLAAAEGIESVVLKCRGKSKAQLRVIQTTCSGPAQNLYQGAYTMNYDDKRILFAEDQQLWSSTTEALPDYIVSETPMETDGGIDPFDRMNEDVGQGSGSGINSGSGSRLLRHPSRCSTSDGKPNSKTISLSFEFDLPEKLIPTISHVHSKAVDAEVYYYLKAVGVRRGIFTQQQQQRKVKIPFVVLDYQPIGSDIKDLLLDWPGPWRRATSTRTVKKAIVLGKTGTVSADLFVPDLPSLPLYAPITVQFSVVTHSRTLELKEKTSPGNIFPELPSGPQDVRLTKHARLTVQIKGHHGDTTEDMGAIFGFKDWPIGPASPGGSMDAGAGGVVTGGLGGIEWHVVPPKWETDEADPKKGRWRQEAKCTTRVVFNGMPSVSCHNYFVEHYLKLEVSLPWSNLRVCAPYHIVSGM